MSQNELHKSDNFHSSDVGNGQRFALDWQNQLLYVPEFNYWFRFDGMRYKRLSNIPMSEAKRTVKRISKEAANESDEQLRTLKLNWALSSHHLSRLKAMIECSKSETAIEVRADLLDQSPYLLNVKNGTIDLRSGILSPHCKEHLFTKLAPVEYHNNASCPTFLTFLDRMFAGNLNVISYLQKCLGYSLTGDCSEHCLFFLYGKGSNGKTTLIKTFQLMLGDYARQLTPNFLMRSNANAHPTEIADLHKVRFATTIEPDEDARLSESLVKWITGNDYLKARRMRQDFWEFEPTHKLWLAANEKPIIKGVNEGIWRRIKLLECNTKIDDSEKDKHLIEKLQTETSGILSWSVEGCLKWRESASGLVMPAEIEEATTRYRQEMDRLEGFLAQCLFGDSYKIKVADLFASYCTWSKVNEPQNIPLTQREFSKSLESHNIFTKKSTGGLYYYFGVRLKHLSHSESGVEDTSGVPSSIN